MRLEGNRRRVRIDNWIKPFLAGYWPPMNHVERVRLLTRGFYDSLTESESSFWREGLGAARPPPTIRPDESGDPYASRRLSPIVRAD